MNTKPFDLAQFDGMTCDGKYIYDAMELPLLRIHPGREEIATAFMENMLALLAECKRQREQIATLREVLGNLARKCEQHTCYYLQDRGAYQIALEARAMLAAIQGDA